MKTQLLLIATLCVSTTFFRCGSSSNSDIALDMIDTSYSFTASSNPPDDVDSTAGPKALAEYAWKEFLALNWKSSYSMDGKKGRPDINWNYYFDTTTSSPDTVVWETYAHRTELSPYHYPMRPFDSLCKYSYKTTPTPSVAGASFGLFHNVDETSEIGSCNMFAYTNRFANNVYGDTIMVRYQAKVNDVEYNYIRDSFPTQNSLKTAAGNTKAYYDSIYAGNKNVQRKGQTIELPNGSIEVKSAWRPLTTGDVAANYFTRRVIVYSYNEGDGKYYYTNKTYALIGLHIIHKSKSHPSFVFATWEHVDVKKDSMQYILLAGNETGGFRSPITNPTSPFSDISTRYVHKHLLPTTSIWQNYRLVGVQGTPNNDTATPNFFLANYVIESDSLLARFHGSGFGSPFDKGNNVVYKNKLYSVGGCQGCHGAGAQHGGSDFSFIVNSPNSSPDKVVGGASSSKIEEFTNSKFNRLKEKYK